MLCARVVLFLSDADHRGVKNEYQTSPSYSARKCFAFDRLPETSSEIGGSDDEASSLGSVCCIGDFRKCPMAELSNAWGAESGRWITKSECAHTADSGRKTRSFWCVDHAVSDREGPRDVPSGV